MGELWKFGYKRKHSTFIKANFIFKQKTKAKKKTKKNNNDDNSLKMRNYI